MKKNSQRTSSAISSASSRAATPVILRPRRTLTRDELDQVSGALMAAIANLK